MTRRIYRARPAWALGLAVVISAGATGTARGVMSVGDMNCDGAINGLDIPLFVNCLLGTNCNLNLVDCDGNPGNGCETNLNTNVNHCGACGQACSIANGTAACVGGACTVGSCDSGYANCDGNAANGCEAELFSDPNHCGNCGVVCPGRPHAGPTCEQGLCGFECVGNYGNCDGNPANGCETNIAIDISNCGACGNFCSQPNAVMSCTAGACVLQSCNAGFGNCDGNAANGCETNTTNNAANCGGCGLMCPPRPNATATCINSACGFVCNANFTDCDGNPANGCEAQLSEDPSNCGGCGIVCQQGQQCVAGVCQ